MSHSQLSIERVQVRAVKDAKADGLSLADIERVKRSGEDAVAFTRRTLEIRNPKRF